MTNQVNEQKWMALAELKQGDKVKLTSGEIVEFSRLKQSKFIGIMNGNSYDIPVNMFVEVVEKSTRDMNAYKKLKKGDAFYTDRDGKGILFIFDSIDNGRIIGRNPIDKSRARIDVSLYGGKVKDIKID